MKELRIPTKRIDPIHNDTPKNTTFFLLDQPSGEVSATGTPINSKNEIEINGNTANWKAIVMVVILQAPNRLNILYHLIPNFQF
jgi:hypothetical protein